MSMSIGIGCGEDRAVLHWNHARREPENAIRCDGFAQCDPAHEGSFDRSFGRNDIRPRPLVEVTNAASKSRRIAPALQAPGRGLLYEEEASWAKTRALPKALSVG